MSLPSFSFISCHFSSFSFSFSTSIQSLFLLPSVSTLYSFSLHFSHVFLCSFLPLDFPWLTLLHFFNVIFFHSPFHEKVPFIHCFIFDSSMHSCTYHFISSMICSLSASSLYLYFIGIIIAIHILSFIASVILFINSLLQVVHLVALYRLIYSVLSLNMLQYDFSIIFQLLQHTIFYFFITFLVFKLLFISFITPFSHPFRILFFYELFISLCSIDCYIQFCLLTCYNTTSRSFFNSFNIPFFIFFMPHFWYSI